MKMRSRAVLWLITTLLAGCVYLPPPRPTPTAPQPAQPPAPQPIPAPRPQPTPAPHPQPTPALPPTATPAPLPAPSRPGRIAERPINLQGACAQIEVDGYRERATLRVRDNHVEALSWDLHVGRRGSCSFEGVDFAQTRSRPHIELQARDGSGCKLMVWRDERRITLAHADCAARCTPGIYDRAWPVMFDPATGGCARL